jgi:hypothetical protein
VGSTSLFVVIYANIGVTLVKNTMIYAASIEIYANKISQEYEIFFGILYIELSIVLVKKQGHKPHKQFLKDWVQETVRLFAKKFK